MAASFLRIGRACSLKLESWNTLKTCSVASLSTKSGDSKKPKKTSIKKAKAKTTADLTQLLQQQKPVKPPGKSISPAATTKVAPVAAKANAPSSNHVAYPVTSRSGATTRPRTVKPAPDLADVAGEPVAPGQATSQRAGVFQKSERAPKLPAKERATAPAANRGFAPVAVERVPDKPSIKVFGAPEVASQGPLLVEDPLKVSPSKTVPSFEGSSFEVVAPIEVAKDLAPTEALSAQVEPGVSPEVGPARVEASPKVARAKTVVAPKGVPVKSDVFLEEAVAALAEAAPSKTSGDLLVDPASSLEEPSSAQSSPDLQDSAPFLAESSRAQSSDEQVKPAQVLEGAADVKLQADGPAKTNEVPAPEAHLDPVQNLFLEKIREYSTKSKLSGGLVDAGPDYERALFEAMTKLQRLHGGGDLTKFPEFTFPEPNLEEVASK